VVGARNWSYNGSNLFDPAATEPSGWLYGTANPQLVNPLNNGTGNYAPQAGSPLIGAGLLTFNGWSAPTLDFNKAARTGSPTIGAIQINSGAGSPPVASFTFAPSIPGAGSPVTFTDTSSNTPNSFSWDFGDGSTSTQASPQHTYAASGTFIVSHTVANTFGSNTATQSITIAGGGGTGGGGGTTPGTAVDLFALFNTRYPCSANLLWVDSGSGNDSNPGTQAAPKQSFQAAINAAGAGTRIRLRAGNYNQGDFNGKNGSAANWIQVVGDAGAVINCNGDGDGGVKLRSCTFIAIYGCEIRGLNQSGGNQYETGVILQGGGHSVAVWNCHIHDISSHAFACIGAARFDVCYNRCHHLARWNTYQTSAISSIGMPNIGAAWPDGYMNHIVGNIIDAVWEDGSIAGTSQYGLTDGNGMIFDYSSGYAGRTLARTTSSSAPVGAASTPWAPITLTPT
jgi:PKD repeat protein